MINNDIIFKVEAELEIIKIKRLKLNDFIWKNEKFNSLTMFHRELLKIQYRVMCEYETVLGARLKDLKEKNNV